MQKQLETLRETHTHEVEDLTKKLEETEDKLWQLKNNVNTVPAPSANASNSLSPYAGVPHTNRHELETNTTAAHHNQHRRQHSHGSEENRIDITNMIREEGEVSTFLPFIIFLFVSLLLGTAVVASDLSSFFLLSVYSLKVLLCIVSAMGFPFCVLFFFVLCFELVLLICLWRISNFEIVNNIIQVRRYFTSCHIYLSD